VRDYLNASPWANQYGRPIKRGAIQINVTESKCPKILPIYKPKLTIITSDFFGGEFSPLCQKKFFFGENETYSHKFSIF
jgi:hypothetical protein